ncbi:MAG: hypothetical protein L3K05_00330 [Thermoplasmata archaeon]|nr:hypothetical protein [Thermoplasmata archaeon]
MTVRKVPLTIVGPPAKPETLPVVVPFVVGSESMNVRPDTAAAFVRS